MNDQTRAPWQQASLDDFNSVDFESPVNGSISADAQSIGDLYSAAISLLNVPLGSTPESRVFSMLAAIMGMYFKPYESNEPFGPMMTYANNRTAIPSDFHNAVPLLSQFAAKINNIPLKARVCDVCWYIDRKRHDLALIAIDAYCDLIEKVEGGVLAFHPERDINLLSHDCRLILVRGLQIANAAARGKVQQERIFSIASRMREASLVSSDLVACLWFSEIVLNFRISDPQTIADAVENILEDGDSDIEVHISVDLWRLAARAFRLAKLETKKNDCLLKAAERLAQHAREHIKMALFASHFLSDAIAQLHGLPGVKDLRAKMAA